MNYSLKCQCGAECTVSGSYDYETNSTDLDLDNAKWKGGNPECSHEEFDIVSSEYDDSHYPDDVI